VDLEFNAVSSPGGITGVTIKFLGWHASAKKWLDEAVEWGGFDTGERLAIHQEPIMEGQDGSINAAKWPLFGYGGTLVEAPFVILGPDAVDHTQRAERADLFEAARQYEDAIWAQEKRPYESWHRDWRKEQGHLVLSFLPFQHEYCGWEREGPEDGLVRLGVRFRRQFEALARPIPNWPGRRPTTILNHAVVGDVKSVAGLDFERIIQVGPGAATVLSPDHPMEPVVLSAGWWLLSHPRPERVGGEALNAD
jgi:hypothetical protein